MIPLTILALVVYHYFGPAVVLMVPLAGLLGRRTAVIQSGWSMRRTGRKRITSLGGSWG